MEANFVVAEAMGEYMISTAVAARKPLGEYDLVNITDTEREEKYGIQSSLVVPETSINIQINKQRYFQVGGCIHKNYCGWRVHKKINGHIQHPYEVPGVH